MATRTGQTEPKSTQASEQEALAALRQHRQQSGYVPWNQNDNEQLRALDQTQKQQAQEQRELREAQALHQRRAVTPTTWFDTVTDALPQVTLVPRPPEPATPAPPPTPTDPLANPPDSNSPELTVKIDPELARVAVGLRKTGEFFIWCIGQHHFGQPGHTTRDALAERVAATGVITSRRHFNRLLKQGAGLFWGLDAHGNVYLRAYVKVSKHLTQMATDQAPKLVDTNIPGVRPVHIPVGDSLNHFKAHIYLGWLTYRQDPTISRATLTRLFNCTKVTLRNWEKLLGPKLTRVTNYTQTAIHPLEDDRVTDYLPDHSYTYVTRKGQIRIRWRTSNTYQTTGIREHAHKGQARKARTVAARTAWYQPVEICEHAPFVSTEKVAFDRSHRVPRQYFDTPDQLQRLIARMEKQGIPAVTPQTPRYVYRGTDRHQHGIWELSLDGHVQTVAEERMPLKAALMWWKGYRAHWTLIRDVLRRTA